MDRKLFYPGQIPLSAQFLNTERNKMFGLAAIAEAIFGTPTLVDGLACIGMTPASLTVQVGPGQIYQMMNVDSTAFGALAADTSRSIMKQGLKATASTFTLTPPATAGQSVNYLIQATLSEVDAENTVLPYVNTADPSLPFTGPNNSGAAQPTTRQATVQLSAKAGVAATTGTQVTPAPDDGYTGLYRVTVPHGATTLDSNNIAVLDTAPFLFKKLPEMPRWVQSGEFAWGDDTGTANAIIVTLTPIPLLYKKGMHIFVKKMNAANSGNVTINVNGLGAVAVLDPNGAQIGAGNLLANSRLHLVYDGAAFIHINGAVTQTTVNSLTAISGEGITVSGGGVVSLNFPGLTADEPTDLDLFAFYNNEQTVHEVVSWANLKALLQAQLNFAAGGGGGSPGTGLVAATPHASVAYGALYDPLMTTYGGPGTLLIGGQGGGGGGGGAQAAYASQWLKTIVGGLNQNTIAASIVNGELVVPAGTYTFEYLIWFFQCGNSQARLFNVSTGLVVHTSVPGYITNNTSSPLGGSGSLVLAAQTTLRLEGFSAMDSPSYTEAFGMASLRMTKLS